MAKTLIQGATAITVDPRLGVIEDADLLIDDGRIVAVGDSVGSPRIDTSAGDQVIDGHDLIVIPGLVNAHIHLWQTAVRALGVNWSGIEFHLRVQNDFVPVLRPEDLRLGLFVGARSLIDAGTTTVLEWHHGSRTPEHVDAAIEGLRASGIRGLFAAGTVKTSPAQGAPHFSQVPYPAAEARRLRDAFGSNDGLLRFGIGILGPDYSPLDVVRHDLALAKELDVISTAHVSGLPGRVEGGYLTVADEGLLHAKHNVVHATAMADDEIRTLIDAGATLTATPTSEVTGGRREPLIRRVIALGGRPSLGTDSEENTSGCMLRELRDSLLVQRLFDHQTAAVVREASKEVAATNVVHRGMDVPPHRVPTSHDALRWATLDSAAALGLQDEIGSISPGKRADLVMFRRSDVNLVPALNPVDTIVGFAHPGNIAHVLIDGRFVKRDGRLVDADRVREDGALLREAGLRILADSGTGALRNGGYGEGFGERSL
ncbi:amidohydrolase family protein [Nocardiopsis sp. MG754419]|uniref:amidohydrolase family protein n=1 Tax=Nocardiopsis sp. MG754419 TaxID=2259865 RepID=UPI001BA9DFE7|nr:amidohydrolase family protein [Nocardiopsis sp. MG754419]